MQGAVAMSANEASKMKLLAYGTDLLIRGKKQLRALGTNVRGRRRGCTVGLGSSLARFAIRRTTYLIEIFG
jgi:hypothetical protein